MSNYQMPKRICFHCPKAWQCAYLKVTECPKENDHEHSQVKTEA